MDGEIDCIVLHAQLCAYLFISLLLLGKVTSAVLVVIKAISWAPVCLNCPLCQFQWLLYKTVSP